MTDHDLEQIRAVISAELTPMRAQLTELQTKIGTWTDLNFLQAAALQQMNEAKQAREFRRHADIKLDEIYGSMATSSEINKLREEVADGRRTDQSRA